MIGLDMMEYMCNYFIGNDPDEWHTDVTNYRAIVLKDIYPGIDLRYSGAGNGRMTYEFIAAPGADLSQIEIVYEGDVQTSLDAEGRLVVTTAWGRVLEAIVATDTDSGAASPGLYSRSENSLGVEEGNRTGGQGESRSTTLAYSTYLGGSHADWGSGIVVDSSGAVYVVGKTSSTDFPTLDPYQTDHAGWGDVFVTKLSGSGGSLVYSTYLGGSDQEEGYDIAVDASGAAYVTGFTVSDDFPTLNPYQTDQGDDDAFITKLSSSGNSLAYCTYLGGNGGDYGMGIAVDAVGAAYVSGLTQSTDFPTLNPFQTDQGSSDAFITKLSANGSSLVYSTYLGGNDHDISRGIAVDAFGAAYVTGVTHSTDFPTLNPYQTDQGDDDAFITKLSSSGNSLVYSTYLGGPNIDYAFDIAVDASGAAYITGDILSPQCPTRDPVGTILDTVDAFVAKLNSAGNTLVYNMTLGGEGSDRGYGIAVNADGSAYVTGLTQSVDFPTVNPFQVDQGGSDAFVSQLSSDGSGLLFSTYVGGTGWESGYGIAVDASGSAYVTGCCDSDDFPTVSPYQTYQGGEDAFVLKLSTSCCVMRADVNHDGTLEPDIADLVYLVTYMFQEGPELPCTEEADINGDWTGPDIADLVHLVNYMFQDGPAPAECP